jgi:hypothetical protein
MREATTTPSVDYFNLPPVEETQEVPAQKEQKECQRRQAEGL